MAATGWIFLSAVPSRTPNAFSVLSPIDRATGVTRHFGDGAAATRP